MINQQLSRFATHENSAYPQLWRGCVGAWCPSLGPSGSRLHDYSRRNNWGTLTNMDPATDWIVSGGQYALDCDATDDQIDCGPNVPSGGACSVAAWVQRIGATPNHNTIAASKGGLQGDSESTFALYFNAFLGWSWFVVDSSNNLTIVRSNTSTSTGVWYFACGVASASAITLYIDGQQRATAAGGLAKSSNHVTKLAGLTDSATSYASNAMLDDVRVYNRALSFGEQLLLSRRRGIAFTPRTRARGTPEQAAGGATPWLYARRRSQIIGAGGVH